MVESPATLRETDTPSPRVARPLDARAARFPRPAVAAHDPSDPDYTAGDVDELVRWQRRAAAGAAPRTR
ncbi:hypothetical protein [Cellulosimicrobium cellulans]|uniref:hypothetical protein n=1 Tax=Cellulosimicrobium cellulans TaxID=1710 RepID=UPI001EDC5F0F|nr:hypothetical protein [Cellulosimicrobium cellulans]